jgi:hypothetical protein
MKRNLVGAKKNAPEVKGAKIALHRAITSENVPDVNGVRTGRIIFSATLREPAAASSA